MFLMILFLLFLFSNVTNGTTIFPAGEWQTSSLKKQSFDEKKITDLFSLVKKQDQIDSILIIRNGYIVAEYTKPGIVSDTKFNLYSCTKSFTSAITGIAIDQGYIKSENQLLSDFFPQAKKDTKKRRVTIHHLLNMTSGLDWPEWTDWGYFFAPMIHSDNWIDFIVNRSMESTPGKRFNYNTGGSHLLSGIIKKATGRNTYEFAKTNLFDKIGMKSVSWPNDPQGVSFGGAWLEMTTRDAARFAYLYLNQGNWNGEQVISKSWIEKSTRKQSAGRRWDPYCGGDYGYQWWINEYQGYETFFAWGAREQYILVTPELNLIAIFTSSFGNGNYRRPPYLYSEYVISSLREAK